MCSTVLSEFTLRMFAIDFFLWSITDCLSINNESRWRTTEAAWKIWKWWVGEWAYFIFFLPGEAQKPDWSEMEDVKQSTALEGREDGWKRKAVCF